MFHFKAGRKMYYISTEFFKDLYLLLFFLWLKRFKNQSLMNSLLLSTGASIGQDFCFKYNQRGTNYGYCQNIANKYMPCGEKWVFYCRFHSLWEIWRLLWLSWPPFENASCLVVKFSEQHCSKWSQNPDLHNSSC